MDRIRHTNTTGNHIRQDTDCVPTFKTRLYPHLKLV